MKSFIVYNADGDILRTGTCPDNMMGIQASKSNGEHILEGMANDVTQKIVKGKIVEKKQ